MNNYQKYEKEIIEILGENESIAVSKGTKKPCCCGDMSCNNCIFQGKGYCGDKAKEWLSSEYKEPIVLTEFEKEVLKRAKKCGYKYIARDKEINGRNNLFFAEKIQKKEPTYWSVEMGTSFTNTDNLLRDDFQFIKWEDDEPYSIDELLKGE